MKHKIIEVKNLSKSFVKGTVAVVHDDVSFKVGTVTVNSKLGASFGARPTLVKLNEGCATIIPKDSDS